MSVTTERRRVDQTEDRRFGASDRDAVVADTRPARSRSSLRRKLLLGAVVVVSIASVVAALVVLPGGITGTEQPLVFHPVKQGDLEIVVTERGNLESQENVEVKCEVDDIHGDGIRGTPILWIIDNGASVKEGDRLVELDSANHQERLDEKILDMEQARSIQIQAKAKYDNRIAQNETLEADADLDVELARLELEMYEDTERGTHKLEVEEIKREIEDINNQILSSQSDLELKKNDMLGIEQLFKLGYAGKSELDRARLSYLQAESAYAATINKLSTQLATLEKKENYEQRMQLLKLQGAVDSSVRKRDQIIQDNAALLEQAKAAMDAADESFAKETELLERYRDQLGKCKIFAPASGMVAFAVQQHHWMGEVRQGAPAAPQQHLMSIPNLESMQVQTAVHESVLDQVRVGLPATIRVDAFPNRSYRGTVRTVAVLPDQGGWASSDTKVYKTTVTIDEKVEQLKPGMTAVVEIHVDKLEDVLSVPVYAVVQVENESWCYVNSGGGVERRVVTLGRTNDKYVEIRDGLDEGDQVVLNPDAVLEPSQHRKEDESAPPDDENAPATEPAETQQPQRPDGTPPNPAE